MNRWGWACSGFAAFALSLAVGVVRTHGAPAVAMNGGQGPVWSPDGTQIAYAGPQLEGTTGLNNLVVMSSSDGSDKRTLAHVRGAAVSEIRWISAQRIVVAINPDGVLESVDTASGSIIKLSKKLENVAIEYQDAAFAVSPDGRTVAYTTRVSASRLGVGLISLRGRATRVLPPPAKLTEEQASYSPDGRRLVLARGTFVAHGGALARPSLVIKGATGGAGRPLGVSGEYPRWSPDGRWIAFLHRFGNRYSRLEIVSAAGGARRMLAGDVAVFSWAPDSRRIAYVHYDGNSQANDSLAVVDVSGTNHALAIDATPEAGPPPVWSPDGKRIAFTGVDPENWLHMSIDVVGADGSGLSRLA